VKFSFFRTIRSHLLLLVLISVLPALGIIIYSGVDRSFHDIEEAKSDALQVVKNFSFDHERAVESTRQLLMTLAKIPDIKNLDMPASNKLLSELLKQNPQYGTLFVVNAQGILYSSGTPLPPTPLSCKTRKYFRDAVKKKDFSVGEYGICPVVKHPVIEFSYPILAAKNQFKGVVVASLDLARFAQMLPMEKIPQGSTLSFGDHKGNLLYHYPNIKENVPKIDLPDMIKNMSAQPDEGVFTYTGVKGVKRLYAYKKFRLNEKEPPYLFIRVGIPEEKALLHARRALSVNLVLLGVAFIIALISAWFLGNFIIVGRLNKLVQASRRLGHGDLKTRTGLPYKRDELGELTKVFDEMVETLETKNAERERAEQTIKKVADEWQTTFDSITDLVMILDKKGRVVRMNDKAAHFFDLPMDRILGDYCFPLLHETGKPLESSLFHKMIETKQHEEADLYFSRSGIWLFVSADPIQDPTGNVIGGVYIVRDISDRKRSEEALKESEKKFRDLAEKSLVGVYIVQDGVFKYANAKIAEQRGYSVEELIDKMGPKDFLLPEDRPIVEENIQKRLSGEVESLQYEFRERTKDNKIINVEVRGSATTYQGRPAVIGTSIDITDRKRAEEKLRESEEIFRQLAENIREVFYIYEQDMHELSYISPAYVEIWGRPCQGLYQEPMSLWDAVHPEDKDRVRGSLEKKSHGEVEEVYRIVRPDGSISWIKERSFPIYDDSGKTRRVVGIAADITDLKLGEQKLKYLSLHDSLTGLYNRIYFEEEMSRIERARYDMVGIVSCDVDGLKLVNDTLGHDQGDNLLVAAARVIKESFRDGDLVARIGGDEFSVVLPNTTEAAVENTCQRIQEAVADYNATNPELPLSISVGFAVSNGVYRNAKDLFKEADNSMYRKKLYRTQSVRSTIVKTLINTLKARDLTTEQHVIRLEKLLALLATFIGLPESMTSDLSLLARFHDIGKVGISDTILFKENSLTSAEWSEMKRHCEIGYRMALSAPELVPIADWILKHHEWWNGQGYPLGIKGEEIPIECRLLGITEAYEAMTSVRPYRRAFSHREAVAELLKHSGTQFDPKLVERFIQMLETHPPELGTTPFPTI
jgi:diguanylate cyclase (GGDEF)-like protein/PAS domain S-box-containing protein